MPNFSSSYESVHYIQIMRIKEMITKDKGLDVETSSPNQYLRKCMEISKENLNIDVSIFLLMLDFLLWFTCTSVYIHG